MNRLTVGLLLGLIAGVPAGAAIHAQYVRSQVPAIQSTTVVADRKPSSTGLAAAGTQFDQDYFYRTDSNPKPAWMPVGIKSDGQKTYIQFPKDLLAPPKPGETSPAPSLVPIGSGAIGYRVTGDQFEVDSVIEKAILVGPTGSKDQVWIYHKSALPKDAN